MELISDEDDFLIKILRAPEEQEEAYRLRHKVFCEELNWVPRDGNGRETDIYDMFAVPIGVTSISGELVGYVRLIFSPHRFMLEKEFSVLLTPGFIKTSDSLEITRLCVKKQYRLKHFNTIANCLYKGVYLASLNQEARFLYMVVERSNYRRLRLTGFPVEVIGGFTKIGDVEAAALKLDLRRFEERAEANRPDFIRWMSTARYRAQELSLRHGTC